MRGLNPRSIIQLSKILPIEIIGTHIINFFYIEFQHMASAQTALNDNFL